jgi:hypothetical protein
MSDSAQFAETGDGRIAGIDTPWTADDEAALEGAFRLPTVEDQLRQAIQAALNEVGVPGPGYPAPVANAVTILQRALAIDGSEGE